MKKKGFVVLSAGILCLVLYIWFQPSGEEVRNKDEDEHQKAILQWAQVTDDLRGRLRVSTTIEEIESIQNALSQSVQDNCQVSQDASALGGDIARLSSNLEAYDALLIKQCQVLIRIYELTDEILKLLSQGLITGVAYNDELEELLEAYHKGESIEALKKSFSDLRPETEADQIVHPLFSEIISAVFIYQEEYDGLKERFRVQGYDFELFDKGNKVYLEGFFSENNMQNHVDD